MQKPWLTFAWAVLCLGALGVVSCRMSDVKVASIDVPAMGDDRTVRIVTNAALDELAGCYSDIRHGLEIDVAKGLALYHESGRLSTRDYQQRIEARLREVGFEPRIRSVQLDPPPPYPDVKGPVQLWPDRHTAVIEIPAMKSRTAANVVANAIGFARVGADDPRIAVDRAARRLTVTYESLGLAPRSLEVAIACSGFAANGVPANLGAPDAVPHGWTPVSL